MSKLNIKEIIIENKNRTLDFLNEVRDLSIKEQNRAAANVEYEKDLYLKLRNYLQGKDYFRLEHFDILEVDYDILIHLSAKGAGKTTEIYRMIDRLIKSGHLFVYGRVSVQELNSAIHQFKEDKYSSVIILTFKNRFYFFTKADVEKWKTKYRLKNNIDFTESVPDPRFNDLVKAGYKYVGEGMAFMNSNVLSGKSYENYSALIFDEILHYLPREVINEKILNAWSACISTILRNKGDKEFKVYLFGNLQNKTTNIILDYYGISIDNKVRVIERGDDKSKCTILYVNSGGLYEGTFKNQAGVSKHMPLDQLLFMKDNAVVKTSDMILCPEIFTAMTHCKAFVLESNYLGKPVVLHIRKYGDRHEGYIYCLSIYELKATSVVEGEIYADNPYLYNRYWNVKKYDDSIDDFNFIKNKVFNKKMYFDSLETCDAWGDIYAEFKIKYDEDYIPFDALKRR